MTGSTSIVPHLATVLDGPGGAPIGYGLVVAPDMVVTCAHVVAAAVAGDVGRAAGPLAALGGTEVTLEFTTEEDLHEVAASASADGWRALVLPLPPTPRDRESDLAALRLAGPLPEGVEPYPWDRPAEAYNQFVEVLGWQRVGATTVPRWTRCETSNRLPRTAWVQLSIRHDAPHEIDRGYSGSPVVRESDGVVLGLLEAKDDSGRLNGGFMIRWREVRSLIEALQEPMLVVEPDAASTPGKAGGIIVPDHAADAPRSGHVVAVLPAVSRSVARDPDYPGLGQYFVERPGLHAHLRDRLLADDQGTASRAAGLCLLGMGGSGKTVLAAQIVSEPGVARRYADGVVWMPAGEAADATALQAALLRKLDPEAEPPADVGDGRARLAAALAGRRVLIVLDDVWEPALIDAVPVTAPSRLLVTSRLETVAARVGESVAVDPPDPAEAREMLRRHAGSAAGDPEVGDVLLDDLTARSGRLPLAMAIVGAMARASGGQWQALRDHLDADHLLGLQAALPDYPAYRTLYDAISASVARLDDAQRQAYLDLAVLPEDVSAPLDLLTLIWADRADDEIAALALANALVDAQLASWTVADELSLHDLQRAFVRAAAGASLPSRHGRLADAARAASGGDWSAVPAAGYLMERLPEHLRAAGRDRERAGLLTDYRWLRAHLTVLGDSAMAERQLERLGAGTAHAVLRLILRETRHLTRTDPGHLPLHLLGRLDPGEAPALAELARQARAGVEPPALVPRWPSLCRTGPTALVMEAPGHAVTAIAITPDGRKILSGGHDGSIRIWDLESGRLEGGLDGHRGEIAAILVMPDGRQVVTGSGDGTVRIWDLASGAVERSPAGGDRQEVTAASLIHAGRQIVVVWKDDSVDLWDPGTGTSRTVVSLEPHMVMSAAVSPDGRWLVGGSIDGPVLVWDLAAPDEPRVLEGHEGWVNAVAWFPDGLRFASGAQDDSVRIWDLRSGQTTLILGDRGQAVTAVSATPDGRWLLSGGYGGALWVSDTVTGETIRKMHGHKGEISSILVTPDRRRLVSGSHDGTVRAWDLTDDVADPGTGRRGVMVTSVSATPDGLLGVTGSLDRTVRILDLSTGAVLRSLVGHTAWVIAVAVTPDGRLVVSGDDDGTVRIWDAGSGKVLGILEGHRSRVSTVAVSADGRWAVSASTDQSIRVWDLADMQQVRVLVEGQDDDLLLALDPCHRRFATGNVDRTVRVWDLETGSLLHEFEECHEDVLVSVALTWDGRQFVTIDRSGTVIVRDLESGLVRATVSGQPLWFASTATSADGRLVAIGSRGGWIRVLDLESGLEVAALPVGAEVVSVAITPDRIVAGDDEGRVHCLDLVR